MAYKIKMLKYPEREQFCVRNIAFLTLILNDNSQSREIKNKALINVCKERNLLKFINCAKMVL